VGSPATGFTPSEFLLDFLVEIVFLVLRLPIAKRHAQRVKERAVRIDARFLDGLVLVLRDKDEVARLAPVLQKRLEGFRDHPLARRAGDTAQRLQLIEVVLDEELAQTLY